MKKLLMIAVATISGTVLSSCAMNQPKTRAEFTNHPKINKQSYTVSRKLDAVVTSLDKRANSCVNGEIVQTRMSGSAVSSSRDYYLMTVTKISATRAELTYRQASNNMAFQPKDGFFLFAADLKARGPQSTEITFYHGMLQKTLMNAVKEWSMGNDKSCHGYGREK